MNLGKVVAHIPARGGSKRVPAKNLRYIAGKPLIAYAIAAARECKGLDEVYVNTDSEALGSLGRHLGCQVYARPAHLGADDATGDDFTIDFIDNIELDTLVMISPVCPLIEPADITAAIAAFAASDADTLISCTDSRLQAFCEGRPINIDPKGPLAPSQMNPVVSICNWAVTIWNAAKFRELYRQFKGGYCGENRILWPLDPLRSVKISDEKDFHLAEALLLARQHTPRRPSTRYWVEEDGRDFLRPGSNP